MGIYNINFKVLLSPDSFCLAIVCSTLAKLLEQPHSLVPSAPRRVHKRRCSHDRALRRQLNRRRRLCPGPTRIRGNLGRPRERVQEPLRRKFLICDKVRCYEVHIFHHSVLSHGEQTHTCMQTHTRVSSAGSRDCLFLGEIGTVVTGQGCRSCGDNRVGS